MTGRTAARSWERRTVWSVRKDYAWVVEWRIVDEHGVVKARGRDYVLPLHRNPCRIVGKLYREERAAHYRLMERLLAQLGQVVP